MAMHEKMAPPFTKKDGAKRPKGKPAAKKAAPMMPPEHEQIGNEIMDRVKARRW